MTARSAPEAGAEGTQLSFFPVRCPCGQLPHERETDLVVWCFCGIEIFSTVAEYNAWASTPGAAA